MSLSVKHGFTSPRADDANPDLVQPSHWNAGHALSMSGPALVGREAVGDGAAQEISLGVGLELSNAKLQLLTKMIAVPTSRAIAATDLERELSCAAGIAITLSTDATLGIADSGGVIYSPTLIFYVAAATPPSFVSTGLTLRGVAPTMSQYKFYALKRVGADEWAWL